MLGHVLSRFQRERDPGNDGRFGLISLKVGLMPIIWRLGCEGSIPGVTFASESLASSVDVLEDFSTCYHQHIAFEVITAICRPAPTPRFHCVWNVSKVNTGRFVEALGTGTVALECFLED